MAKPANYDVRNLFTEIGCIMEDASVVALVWSSKDELDIRARFHRLSDAHKNIGDLLSLIATAA